jgi:threonine synthase
MSPGDPETPIDVVLPTGAMGNAVGGCMAKKMGVPFGTFSAAVNVNDITHRVIQTGKFHKSDSMIMTLSEAINIQLPYNFERILYYLSEGETTRIKEWMAIVDATNKNDLPPDWLALLQKEFQSERVTDDEMCATMRKVCQDYQYMTDPHTAVAFSAAEKLGFYKSQSQQQEQKTEKKKPIILLSTASPCKFEESVTTALGKERWNQYVDKSFPPRAKETLKKEEVEPVVFNKSVLGELEESQKEWETKAQKILDELGEVGK